MPEDERTIQYVYDALARLIEADHAFTGEPRDANALQYHRARYYAPGLAVWTALDPWEGLHERPMSLNGYSWVEGNVPNLTDPSGEVAPAIAVAAAAVAAVPIWVWMATAAAATAYLIINPCTESFRRPRECTEQIELLSSALQPPLLSLCAAALEGLFSMAQGGSIAVPGAPAHPREEEGSGGSLRDALDKLPLRHLARWYLLRYLRDHLTDRVEEASPRRHISLGIQAGLRLLSFTINLNAIYNPVNITVHPFQKIDGFDIPGWYEVGLTSQQATASNLDSTFPEATATAEAIHFNLEGIEGIDVAGGILKFAALSNGRFIGGGSAPITATELYIIRANPALCRKTFFYEHGSVFPPLFSIARSVEICGSG